MSHDRFVYAKKLAEHELLEGAMIGSYAKVEAVLK